MAPVPSGADGSIELGVFTFGDLAGAVAPGERIRDIVDFGVRADPGTATSVHRCATS